MESAEKAESADRSPPPTLPPRRHPGNSADIEQPSPERIFHETRRLRKLDEKLYCRQLYYTSYISNQDVFIIHLIHHTILCSIFIVANVYLHTHGYTYVSKSIRILDFYSLCSFKRKHFLFAVFKLTFIIIIACVFQFFIQ
jgi:hypothetical protein